MTNNINLSSGVRLRVIGIGGYSFISSNGAATVEAGTQDNDSFIGPYSVACTVGITPQEGATLFYDDSGLPIDALLSADNASGAQGIANRNGQTVLYSPSNGVVVAGLGDSITAQNTYGSPLLMRSIGYMAWAICLSKGKINFSNDLNFGVSGQTTEQILARTPSAISSMKAQGTQFCVVHAATNDLSAIPTIAPATSVANLRSIYTQLLAAGISPIAVPVLPRSFSMTASQILRLQSTNNLIRSMARSIPGVLVADPTLHITDQANASGFPLGANTASATAMTVDGLHPSTRGAYWLGYEIVQSILAFLPAQSTQTWSQADLYDATDNQSGSIMLNPMMAGTAGTLGLGASGQVADSWTAKRQSGTTGVIVCSKTSISADASNSYPAQQLVFSAPSGSSSEIFRYEQLRFSGIAIGDPMQGECEISVSGVGAGSLRYIKLSVSDGVQNGVFFQNDTGFYMPDNSWSGVFKTPKIISQAVNVALLQLEVCLDGTVSGNGVTVTITRAPIRKVF